MHIERNVPIPARLEHPIFDAWQIGDSVEVTEKEYSSLRNQHNYLRRKHHLQQRIQGKQTSSDCYRIWRIE